MLSKTIRVTMKLKLKIVVEIERKTELILI